METIQFTLPQSRIPVAWYNIAADLPKPMAPPLHPGTLQPIGPADLAPLFPMALILQEVSTEREIEIPGPVRQVYAQWRPAPLCRARRLEQALDTPARIYYKYEGVSPAGSHKPNTAVPQAYYNKVEGTKRLSTETGAGQWGSALAMACAFFGLECKVYMVRVSYDQKPYRRALMEVFGASVTPSPSNETESGRAILAQHPKSNGSLGIAISEAVEVAAKDPNTKYALGSVLNHVLLHQTVIGLETIEQMALANDEPDIIIGCTGGGSNFAGLVMPYLGRKIKGQCRARANDRQRAGIPNGIGRQDHGDHLGFMAEAFREQRADRTIDQPAGEDFLFRGTPFALDVSARNSARGVRVFAVIDCEWEKACADLRLGRHAGGDQHHRITGTNHYRSVSLFGHLACFQGNLAGAQINL